MYCGPITRKEQSGSRGAEQMLALKLEMLKALTCGAKLLRWWTNSPHVTSLGLKHRVDRGYVEP